MYKVFIKDSSIKFTDQPAENALPFESQHQLRNIFLQLEDAVENQHLLVYHSELGQLWENWCALFQIIEAAGGLVVNARDQLLLIRRLGKWDLPKGKLEEGEKPEAAAVREVMEECAVPRPAVVRSLPDSYHTYRIRGEAILKRTYWFEMRVQGVPEVSPQIEEDITEVIWCDKDQLGEKLADTYGNIANLINYYLAQ